MKVLLDEVVAPFMAKFWPISDELEGGAGSGGQLHS